MFHIMCDFFPSHHPDQCRVFVSPEELLQLEEGLELHVAQDKLRRRLLHLLPLWFMCYVCWGLEGELGVVSIIGFRFCCRCVTRRVEMVCVGIGKGCVHARPHTFLLQIH